MEREIVLLLFFLVLGCCDRLSSKLGQSLEVFSSAPVHQTVQEMDATCAEWAWDWTLAYLLPPRAWSPCLHAHICFEGPFCLSLPSGYGCPLLLPSAVLPSLWMDGSVPVS